MRCIIMVSDTSYPTIIDELFKEIADMADKLHDMANRMDQIAGDLPDYYDTSPTTIIKEDEEDG